jgi:hypothetical protein
MSRRYLALDEAESALNRGKSVEVFLGGFVYESKKCIRWASFVKSTAGVCGSLWEAFDQGSSDYVDIYTFDSPSGEYDEPKKIIEAPSLEAAARELGIKNLNFVNQGIVQDEYAQHIETSI